MNAYKYRANLADERGFRRDMDSLLKCEFFASSLAMLNDPFEGSCELSQAISNDRVEKLNSKFNSVGIYSLAKQTENETFPSNELLWAHYANSHKGFCIEYDWDKLIAPQNNDLQGTMKVRYIKSRPTLSTFDISNPLITQKKILGSKSVAWKYENEVRLLFHKNGIKRHPSNAIQSIYFGLNSTLDERQIIMTGLHDLARIKFYQINRIANTYQLIANLLSPDDVNMFEISHEHHYPHVENYYIFYYSNNTDKNSLLNFVQKFRQSRGNRPLNISIFDTKLDKILFDKYPLTDSEAIIFTKHWLAYSSFDAPDQIWMHPDQTYLEGQTRKIKEKQNFKHIFRFILEKIRHRKRS